MKWVTKLGLLFVMASAQSAADTGSYSSYTPFEVNRIKDTRFQHVSGGGSDRCSVSDCLCAVSVTDPGPPSSATTVDSRRSSVFFLEGSSVVSSEKRDRIKDYVTLHKGLETSYTVIGYTDECGSHAYNMGLVKKRTHAIKDILHKEDIERIDLTIFNPESGSGHNPESRRVDIIVHTTSRVTTMIEKIQADVYLIDASGSMWTGWKNWVDVVAVSFKTGSRVYLSKTIDCTSGQTMESVTPSGGTEIWYSYWKVLEFMKPGETLAIISDFKSNVPLTRREAGLIDQKVRERKIKVIAVSP